MALTTLHWVRGDPVPKIFPHLSTLYIHAGVSGKICIHLSQFSETTALCCNHISIISVLCLMLQIYRGYYVAVRRYGFYLRVLIISLTSERSERVRDVFNTRRLNSYLQLSGHVFFFYMKSSQSSEIK